LRNILFILLVVITSLRAGSQILLKPEEAVSIALKNNYEILVAGDEATIDSINNTPGNAGMLPYISAVGATSYSWNDTVRKFTNGSEYKSSNNNSNILNAGVDLTWTLFDGGKMFVTKRKLSEIEALGALQYKEQVQQTIYDVIVAYYNVVKQKQQMAFIKQVIIFNQERVKILQTSLNAGLSPKTNLLQAKIDLNVFLENEIDQEAIILEARRNLNRLLSRDSETIFEVSDSIPLSFSFDKEELSKSLLNNSPTILAYEKLVSISEMTVRENNALRFPKINFNAGYNFLQSKNSRSSVSSNSIYGPSVGATITVPIFQAGNITRQVKASRLQFQSARYNLEYTKIQINLALRNAINDYENQQKLYIIEKENALLAKENVELSMQRLRLGQTTSLELRQAEESYEDAMTRLLNFQFNLKVAETKLKQLLANL
jgi:outer membrane protein